MYHNILPPQKPIEPASLHAPMVYVREKVKWEYKQVLRDLTKETLPSEEELNALGADGWELAGIAQNSSFTCFYFKRSVGE